MWHNVRNVTTLEYVSSREDHSFTDMESSADPKITVSVLSLNRDNATDESPVILLQIVHRVVPLKSLRPRPVVVRLEMLRNLLCTARINDSGIVRVNFNSGLALANVWFERLDPSGKRHEFMKIPARKAQERYENNLFDFRNRPNVCPCRIESVALRSEIVDDEHRTWL